jgi:hypothetical protein
MSMTNAELIAHLQTLPPDLPVVVSMYHQGEMVEEELDAEEVSVTHRRDRFYTGLPQEQVICIK